MEMNKEFFNNKIDEIFLDKKSREIFKKQIDNYINLTNFKVKTNHKYKIGDSVKLYKGMFMRGEGSLAELDEKKLNNIKEYFPNCYISNLDGKVIL